MQKCSRCNKFFSNKSNLTKHLRKQNLCIVVDTLNMISDADSEHKVNTNDAQSEHKVNTTGSNSEHKVNTKMFTKVDCEFCGREFNQKTSYYRHKRSYCCVLRAERKQNEFAKELLEKYEELKTQGEENSNQLKDELQNKITQLEEKIIEQQQIITQTTINGNVNQGNITNNIMINNFGEEKFNLTSAEVEEIMAAKYNMHTALIKKIHIDNPDNRNFLIVSMKDKHAIVIKNGEKVYVNRLETIDKFVTKA